MLPEGWFPIVCNLRNSDPAGDKATILDRATDWFFLYETRFCPKAQKSSSPPPEKNTKLFIGGHYFLRLGLAEKGLYNQGLQRLRGASGFVILRRSSNLYCHAGELKDKDEAMGLAMAVPTLPPTRPKPSTPAPDVTKSNPNLRTKHRRQGFLAPAFYLDFYAGPNFPSTPTNIKTSERPEPTDSSIANSAKPSVSRQEASSGFMVRGAPGGTGKPSVPNAATLIPIGKFASPVSAAFSSVKTRPSPGPISTEVRRSGIWF